jgi:hypothetical protein
MGIDPERLRESLAGLTDEDVARVAREVFGPERRVAVTAKPR